MFTTLIPFIICTLAGISAARVLPRSASSQCTPLHTTFPTSSVGGGGAQFVALSPSDGYQTGGNGLELFLKKPSDTVTTKGGVNDKVAQGATVNSTFTMLYGKVTFEVQAPVVAGIVTATILIADEHDEIDIELLGGDSSHWQTNVYAPASATEPPLWGVFSGVEDVPKGGSVGDVHSYTIDWTAERIAWSVDGAVVRTITPEQTSKNGKLHYPSHPARVQMGIWDASDPVGTAEWAKGPVNWSKAPAQMSAVIKSVTIEC